MGRAHEQEQQEEPQAKCLIVLEDIRPPGSSTGTRTLEYFWYLVPEYLVLAATADTFFTKFWYKILCFLCVLAVNRINSFDDHLLSVVAKPLRSVTTFKKSSLHGRRDFARGV